MEEKVITFKYKDLEAIRINDSRQFKLNLSNGVRTLNNFMAHFESIRESTTDKDKGYLVVDLYLATLINVITQDMALCYAYYKAKDNKPMLKKLKQIVAYCDSHYKDYTDFLNDPPRDLASIYDKVFIKGTYYDTANYIYIELDKVLA